MFAGVLDVCLIRRDAKTIYKHPLAIRIPIFRHLGMSSPKPQKQILWSMRCHVETWNHRWLQLGKMGFPWLLETSFREDTGRLEFWTLAELLPTQMFLSMYLYRSNFMVNGAGVFPHVFLVIRTRYQLLSCDVSNCCDLWVPKQFATSAPWQSSAVPAAISGRSATAPREMVSCRGVWGLDDERQWTTLW